MRYGKRRLNILLIAVLLLQVTSGFPPGHAAHVVKYVSTYGKQRKSGSIAGQQKLLNSLNYNNSLGSNDAINLDRPIAGLIAESQENDYYNQHADNDDLKARAEGRDVCAEIKDRIHNEYNIPLMEITPESKLQEDLGFDSLQRVEMILWCEEHFDIQIPDEDAEHLVTCGDLCNYVKNASM